MSSPGAVLQRSASDEPGPQGRRLPGRSPRTAPKPRRPLVNPPEGRLVASYVVTMLWVMLASMLVSLIVVSQLQHYVSQRHLYAEFRQTLAEGSVPIGQSDVNGDLVEPGTPVAQLKIPSIGVDEIVVDGTTSGETMKGVGHRRDTPMPGQAGVSVLAGRKAAYGGVFGDLATLRPGAAISVLTGQGTAQYKVLGVRGDKTELPVLGPDDGRLTLTTASGPAYRPNGVTRVDAELVTDAVPRPPVRIAAGSLPEAEQALEGDTSRAFALTWLLQLLALAMVAAIWSWKRWQRAATWLVFAPVLTAIGLGVAASVTVLLPNLL